MSLSVVCSSFEATTSPESRAVAVTNFEGEYSEALLLSGLSAMATERIYVYLAQFQLRDNPLTYSLETSLTLSIVDSPLLHRIGFESQLWLFLGADSLPIIHRTATHVPIKAECLVKRTKRGQKRGPSTRIPHAD